MAEVGWLAILLLPLAALSGWLMASRYHRHGERKQHSSISSNYFRGLNYLLNEQPDKAIEVFLRLAEINQETVETHLALGNLFRRRGEVDKAIRFHRHIMTRPNLSDQHRTQALLELGEDYMRAGLLDRAEKLFSELGDEGRCSETAARSLLSIYQQEKDWGRAIVQARALQRASGEPTSGLVAMFHCELAEEALQRGDSAGVSSQLESARSYQKDCTRASLIEGELAFSQERWEAASTAYRRACDQDPDLITLVLESLLECHARQGGHDSLSDWLTSLAPRASTAAPILAIARLQVERDPAGAIRFLLDHLQERPSVRGLHYLLDLMHKYDHDLDEIDPGLLRQLMRNLLKGQPRFRCQQCGFSGQTWHWQCPSCRQWDTTRPVSGVLGE